MILSDQDILNELKKDNYKPYENYFKLVFPELVKYAYSLTLSKEIAEEIVQDSFIYIWNNCSKIFIKSSLKSYLITSVKHASINYLKKKNRIIITDEAFISDWSSLAEIFSQPLEASELKTQIKKAIYRLPAHCRAIFLLSRFTELTYLQIASELGISVKTVEAQMSIALSRIRKYLDQSES